MSEQSLSFTKSRHTKNEELEAFLEFSLQNENMEHYERLIPFSGGAELESILKMHLNKEWNLLFPEDWKGQGVEECTLEGIQMTGTQEKGRFSTHYTDYYKRNTFIFNSKAFADENKEKLLKIRSILLE